MKTEYIVDKFIDFTGTERNFVIAAVSVGLKNPQVIYIPNIDSYNEWDEGYDYILEQSIEKYLLLGISVCNAGDTFDVELGKRIAQGKALKFKGKQLIVSHAGLVNTKMVRALLEQEAEYFKRDPGSYIAGYREQARKYREKK